ncbi:MAG: NYN domain-containing protein [Candidatus Kapabacteria bacterium]|nr:NYN domain-containing protein [Candidatus Kapabacteria bacterium]
MKLYLLDTNNILHADADLKRTMKSDPDAALGRLVLKIDAYAARHRTVQFILALDSVLSKSPTQSYAVTYLIPEIGETADILIKRMVASWSSPAGKHVVTNDTEVHNHARIHGVAVLSPAALMTMLQGTSRNETAAQYEPPPKPLGVSKKHIRSMKDDLSAPLDDDSWLEMMNVKRIKK